MIIITIIITSRANARIALCDTLIVWIQFKNNRQNRKNIQIQYYNYFFM